MAASNHTIFNQILEEAKRAGITNINSKHAREWLRERARDVPDVSEDQLIDSKEERLKTIPSLGSLYLFKYDPKTADKLPYYDTLPLVFPTEWHPDGFAGLNMHYLPHGHRANLMDKLYAFNSDSNFNTNAKLMISYGALSYLSNYQAFRPCYKRYLFSHCQSRFLFIHPKEWEIALFLPLERWQKASASTIYNDSLGKIRRRKRKLS